MNIVVAIIVGLKRAPECIKMHHFEGEHAKIFLGRGTAPSPDPTPTGEGHTPRQTPSPDLTPISALGALTAQTTFHAPPNFKS